LYVPSSYSAIKETVFKWSNFDLIVGLINFRLSGRERKKEGFPSELKLNTRAFTYEGWNFNSGNYLFTTDTK